MLIVNSKNPAVAKLGQEILEQYQSCSVLSTINKSFSSEMTLASSAHSLPYLSNPSGQAGLESFFRLVV